MPVSPTHWMFISTQARSIFERLDRIFYSSTHAKPIGHPSPKDSLGLLQIWLQRGFCKKERLCRLYENILWDEACAQRAPLQRANRCWLMGFLLEPCISFQNQHFAKKTLCISFENQLAAKNLPNVKASLTSIHQWIQAFIRIGKSGSIGNLE